MAAPGITSVVGTIEAGATGIQINGGGFGPFAGTVDLTENADGSGASDALSITSWNDLQVIVDIPGSLNNAIGAAYIRLFDSGLNGAPAHEVTVVQQATPTILSFGDGVHEPGESGLTVDGLAFGVAGQLWVFETAQRTGLSAQLSVDTWTDTQLTGVSIPASLDPGAGNGVPWYLFAQRSSDSEWSDGFAFAIENPGVQAISSSQNLIYPLDKVYVIFPRKNKRRIPEFQGLPRFNPFEL